MTESVHLLGKGGTPIGVLHRPERPVSDIAVVFLNSGLLHRVGPFRLYVDLARRLAADGIASLRIDQSGKGDSERRTGLSFTESIEADFDDARRFLAGSLGTRRFVLLGLCSGADDALYLSSQSADVVGAVLLEPYAGKTFRFFVRHYGPRILRLDLWLLWSRLIGRQLLSRLPGRRNVDNEKASAMRILREVPRHDEMRHRFRATLDRDAKLLCVFTGGAKRYYNYTGQLSESLGIGAGHGAMTEVHMPSAKHTYPLVEHRDELIERVRGWIAVEFGGAERAHAHCEATVQAG